MGEQILITKKKKQKTGHITKVFSKRPIIKCVVNCEKEKKI